MVEKRFGDAGNKILVEERLYGEEASFIAFTDGKTVMPMISTQDHKPIYDNDKGPNTGGMGAYGPATVVTNQLHEEMMEKVMKPTIKGMRKLGTPYKGILYAGLMMTNQGPMVLEYNCRFGDPETQPILALMKADLLKTANAVVDEELDKTKVDFKDKAACCVVLASGGYPGKYKKGKIIYGINNVKESVVFHAGTARQGQDYITNGGRVLGVTAVGDKIEEAIQRAYTDVRSIKFENMFFRRDIGKKALCHIKF